MELEKFTNLVVPFLDHVTYERQLSPHTRKSYFHDLRQLERFWADLNTRERHSFSLADTLRRHLVLLQHEKMHFNSIARKISCFNSYVRFINGKGYAALEVDLPRPHIPVQTLPIIPFSELRELELRVIDNTQFLLRDRLIFKLVFDTGMRSSELVELTCGTVNRELSQVIIRSPRRRERSVAITARAVQQVDAYLRHERPEVKSEQERLLCNYRGLSLTARSVQRVFESIQKELNVPYELTSQVVRNSYAVALLQQGVSPHDVQERLGHEVYASVEKYFPYV